jgi:hypothetical protein
LIIGKEDYLFLKKREAKALIELKMGEWGAGVEKCFLGIFFFGFGAEDGWSDHIWMGGVV